MKNNAIGKYVHGAKKLEGEKKIPEHASMDWILQNFFIQNCI